VVASPPPVPNITKDEKRHGCQVKNATIQSFGGTFTHLLGRFCADRTLCLNGQRDLGCYNKNRYQHPLFHLRYNVYTKLLHEMETEEFSVRLVWFSVSSKFAPVPAQT